MNEIGSGTFNTSQRLSPCIPTHGSTNENESDPSSQTFSRIHIYVSYFSRGHQWQHPTGIRHHLEITLWAD